MLRARRILPQYIFAQSALLAFLSWIALAGDTRADSALALHSASGVGFSGSFPADAFHSGAKKRFRISISGKFQQKTAATTATVTGLTDFLHMAAAPLVLGAFGDGPENAHDKATFLNYLLAKMRRDQLDVFVALDSRGGHPAQGIALAAFFKRFGFATHLEEGAICHSACAIAFMGGSDYANNDLRVARSMHPTADLGFHKPFLKADIAARLAIARAAKPCHDGETPADCERRRAAFINVFLEIDYDNGVNRARDILRRGRLLALNSTFIAEFMKVGAKRLHRIDSVGKALVADIDIREDLRSWVEGNNLFIPLDRMTAPSERWPPQGIIGLDELARIKRDHVHKPPNRLVVRRLCANAVLRQQVFRNDGLEPSGYELFRALRGADPLEVADNILERFIGLEWSRLTLDEEVALPEISYFRNLGTAADEQRDQELASFEKSYGQRGGLIPKSHVLFRMGYGLARECTVFGTIFKWAPSKEHTNIAWRWVVGRIYVGFPTSDLIAVANSPAELNRQDLIDPMNWRRYVEARGMVDVTKWMFARIDQGLGQMFGKRVSGNKPGIPFFFPGSDPNSMAIDEATGGPLLRDAFFQLPWGDVTSY